MKDIRSYTPLPVCTTNIKKLPLVGIRNFSTQNNSIIKKRLAISSHIILGVQVFAELQILLKSVLHKRKRRENTLLTAKDTPFVSLTGCHPDSRTRVFLTFPLTRLRPWGPCGTFETKMAARNGKCLISTILRKNKGMWTDYSSVSLRWVQLVRHFYLKNNFLP